VRAALDAAIHSGLAVSCRSSNVTSGVTAKVPLELPVIAKLVRAPERQSRATGSEVPTLDRVTLAGFAI
jgi:hypothetical protein